MNRFDKKVLSTLKYLYEHKKGYISDLKTNIDMEIFEQFEIVGLVHRGYTLKDRTWSITELGKQYYNELK